MKKSHESTIIKSVLFLFLVFSLFNFKLFSQEASDPKVIRVGWYESACFQEGMSHSEDKSGYAYEYLARISDYTAWKYEYVYGEWADLYEKLKSGQIDVLAGVSITEERKKYMLFPNYVMGTDNYYLYQHSDSPSLDPENPDSFAGKKLGGVKDNRMTTYLEQWLKNNGIKTEVVYYDGFSERDEAFSSYKIDAIAATDNNIKTNSGYTPVAKVGEESFYLAVTKNRNDILIELNSVLGTLLHLSPNYLDALQVKCYGSTLANSILLKEEQEWFDNHPVVKVGYLKDYMPFCGLDKSGNVSGIITDIASSMLGSLKTNTKVQLDYIAYESPQEMAEALTKDEIDLSFPVIAERRYLTEMDIAGTFEIISVPFVVGYKGTISDDTFDVIITNTRPLKSLMEGHTTSTFIKADSAEKCLDAIQSGKATCTIMSSYRLMELLNNRKYSDIKTMPYSENIDYCIGINKNSTILLRILNKGISFLNKTSIIDASYKYLQENSQYTAGDFIKEHLSFFIFLFLAIFASFVIGFGVYLGVIRKSKLKLQENLEKVNILAALSQEYEAVHVADLDLKTLSTMRLSKGMEQFDYEVSTLPYASAVVSLVNQFVLTDMREDFLKFLEIEAMKRRMEENNSFTYRYGIVNDGSGHYIYEMTFVRVSNDLNRHLLVIGTKSIDDILRYEREQGQYNEALLSESSFFYGFDVTDGRIDGKFITKKGYNPLFDLKLEFPMTYDEFNQIRSEELGMYAATEQESELWTCEGLKKSYREGKKTVSIRYASTKLDIYWTATIILTEDDISHHLHAVYICKDVSDTVKDQQKRQNELEKALEAAEQANRAKTMFLNNMSHDIRTPMNAILGFADLMEKEKENPEALSGHLKKLKDSGEYLLEIINNVLDMARIESGKTPVVESIMDLENAEEFVISAFEDLMKEKNQKFIVTKNIQHRYVLLDCPKHQQITMNLISNAIKYTPENGEIRMNLEEFPCEESGFGTYVMTISDNGIGMKPEFVEHIFDSFSRERNTTESKIIGTGLGMSIVKRLVDLLGGTIEVESEPGIGSKFTVTFKHKIVLQQETKTEEEQSVDVEEEKLNGKRILLVEDNEFNAEIATVILEDFGLLIDHACDGVECIDMLEKSEENYYDLILMDIQMPNMDGYQTTELIRKMEDSYRKNIPIIAMTANAFEEDKKKAFDAGMNSHLAKPIKSNEVKSELERFLCN